MRVLFDGIAFENSRQRGVQRYCRELIGHLPDDVDVELVVGDRAKAALPERARSVQLVHPPVSWLSRSWRRRLMRPARRRLEARAEVFHASYFRLPESDMPAVVSVQDMIVERFVDYFHNDWAQGEVRRKREAILGATLILMGAHAAAAELRAFYPEVSDRIVVTPYGADHLREAGPDAAGSSNGDAALFVGDRALYKNFRTLLEAMGSARWPRGVGLKVVGPPPLENELVLVSRMAGAGRVEFLGRVDDAALSRLYAAAAATVVPSLEEGFGFPVLEGQRAGSPMVCSDIPVFRETAAESALFFDPTRPEQLADAVARACEPRQAARLRELGRENARRFTWAACAAGTVEAYRQAIEWRRAGTRGSG